MDYLNAKFELIILKKEILIFHIDPNKPWKKSYKTSKTLIKFKFKNDCFASLKKEQNMNNFKIDCFASLKNPYKQV